MQAQIPNGLAATRAILALAAAKYDKIRYEVMMAPGYAPGSIDQYAKACIAGRAVGAALEEGRDGLVPAMGVADVGEVQDLFAAATCELAERDYSLHIRLVELLAPFMGYEEREVEVEVEPGRLRELNKHMAFAVVAYSRATLPLVQRRHGSFESLTAALSYFIQIGRPLRRLDRQLVLASPTSSDRNATLAAGRGNEMRRQLAEDIIRKRGLSLAEVRAVFPELNILGIDQRA